MFVLHNLPGYGCDRVEVRAVKIRDSYVAPKTLEATTTGLLQNDDFLTIDLTVFIDREMDFHEVTRLTNDNGLTC